MTRLFFVVLLSCFTTLVFSQTEALRTKIEKLVQTKQADIGVAIRGLESKDTLSINGARHYPMQSVFKFHIALAVLNEVDKGKFSLDTAIPVNKSDLKSYMYSPLRDKYPDGDINLPLREILAYTVSLSDNPGCDILLRLIGGPKTVNDYIHSLGVNDISIMATEDEMHKEWDVQFKNWSTPVAAVALLNRFYRGNILSKPSHDFLWKTMAETPTGKKRIRGQLPVETTVVHKTGTSGTKDGITSAVNDIGIVMLPNGKHFAICVFVSNSKEDSETNEKIIADIGKMAWDYFNK